MRLRMIAVALSLVVLAVSLAWCADESPDPYWVLNRYYDALGGLNSLRAEKTLYVEASFTVSGLSGTLRRWEARPDRNRTEVDLGPFSQVSGDNGSEAWTTDANGKTTIERDPTALARRDVAVRMEKFEHLDPGSDVFDVTFVGTEPVGEDECYIVRIASEPDHTVRDWYIDTSDFLLRESAERYDEQETRTVYSDYRPVDGVLHSFEQQTELLPIGQEETRIVTVLDHNVAIEPGLFDPPEEGAADYVFTEGGDSAEVPIQLIERHLFLPVTINCKESLWVLDSGASMSVVDRKFAEKLGLPMSGSLKGEAAGNAVDVSFTTLPPFGVEGVSFSEQQVAAIDIAPLFRTTSDLEIAGILGYDFLSRFVSRVDYANETLTLYDPAIFEYHGDGTTLDAPLSGNLFTVEAVVDGVYDGRWVVDLGAGGCTFNAPYVKEHELSKRPGILGVGFGAGGRIDHYMSRFDTIELGGYTVERPVISLAGVGGDVIGAFSASEKTGNLGNSILRHFTLYLDYANQQMIVEKGDDFGKDFPWDRSGLQLWRPEGEVCRVLFVAPGTPADESGFQAGDALLRVNGIAVENIAGLEALRKMLSEAPGTKYVMTIEREGKRRDLELVLRELM